MLTVIFVYVILSILPGASAFGATNLVADENTIDKSSWKSAQNTECQGDYYFVLDSSGSQRLHFDLAKSLMMRIVEEMKIGKSLQRVALFQYSSSLRSRLKFKFNEYYDKEKVLNKIKHIHFSSGITATGFALGKAMSELNNRRTAVRTTVVVLTDGFSHDSVQDNADAIRKLPNVVLYAVGTTDKVNIEGMKAIAGIDQNVMYSSNIDDLLQQLLQHVLDCNPVQNDPTQPPITTTIASTTTTTSQTSATTPPSTTSTSITTTTTTTATTTTTTIPQTTTLDPSRCDGDFVLVLDASGSQRREFDNVVQYAKALSKRLVLANGIHRAAIIEFSSEQRQYLKAEFGDHNDTESLAQFIEQLPYFGGTTAIGEALKLTAKELEKRRKDGPAHVLVLTDGYSKDKVSTPGAALRAMENVQVWAVALPKYVNKESLLEIVKTPKRIFYENDPSQLISAIGEDFFTC